MTRSLKAAAVFGFGGVTVLRTLDTLFRSDGRSLEEEVAAVGFAAGVLVAMGAAGGWVLMSGVGDKARTVRASVGFAIGFLLPAGSLFMIFAKPEGAMLLFIPVCLVAAPCIGMLFVKPRRALHAAVAFAGLIAAIIPILGTLDYLESIGYSGSPFIALLFYLAYLIPFAGGGAVLGVLAEPTDEDKTASPDSANSA